MEVGRKRLREEDQNEIQNKQIKSGGTYVPPAVLAARLKDIPDDPADEQYQRIQWEALKKSLNGLINKVNTANIKDIIYELFGENLIRGRGLFVKSVINAQSASPVFTNVYAALISVINTKLPEIGQLIVKRLIYSFQRAYKRKNKQLLTSTLQFIAHLVNQQVAHEIVALQIIALLLEKPTDDSVEVAVSFVKEVGQFLSQASPKATFSAFDQFRTILHEDLKISKRVQYSIEVLFQIRKDGFKQYPSKIHELDLVEEDDQITHFIGLDDVKSADDIEEGLNVFKYDSEYEKNQNEYLEIKREIIGDSDDEDESNDDTGDVKVNHAQTEASTNEEEYVQDQQSVQPQNSVQTDQQSQQVTIHDQTGSQLIALRKRIYLTIMSSIDFEESCHKLLKLNLNQEEDQVVCSMVIECASQEHIYQKYYGLMAERLCRINKKWSDLFQEEFKTLYLTIHRYEINRIRIIAQIYAHLFHTDSIFWGAMDCIQLTEDDTTSSSRIFLKILFQELLSNVGKDKMKQRLLEDQFTAEYFAGLFPTDNAKNIRFAINYWTSIQMGFLTDKLRELLNSIGKITHEQQDENSSEQYERRRIRQQQY